MMVEAMAKRPKSEVQVDLLLIKEAAEILGVSEMTLRRWDKAGTFKARRHPINNFRVYARAAVMRLRKQIQSGKKSR